MNIVHGLSKTQEYRLWAKIKQRCFTKSHHAYARYGAKGITMCERWRYSYLNFAEDMGPRPSPKHSVDRIDNNGIYEPSNCRWATVHQQAINRSDNVKNPGVNWDNTKNTWKAMLTIDRIVVLNKRFRNYDDAVKARQQAEIKYKLEIDNPGGVLSLF